MNMSKISKKLYVYIVLFVVCYFYFYSNEVIITAKLFLNSYQDIRMSFGKLKGQKCILTVRKQRRFSSRLP